MSLTAGEMRPGQSVVRLGVELELLLPNGIATEAQVTEWLDFKLGKTAIMRADNPLTERELSALKVRWQTRGAGVVVRL